MKGDVLMHKTRSYITLFFTQLFDVFFPKCCLVCNRAGEYLCLKHKKTLLAYVPCCYVCDRPTLDGGTCLDHQDAPCKGVVVGFYYTTLVKEMIHAIKYQDGFEILDFFTQSLYYAILATPILSHAYQQKTLLVTYVPMHPWKENHQRGYNQSKLLAENLANKLQLSCIQLCKKVIHTKKQSVLGKQARKTNTQDVFQWCGDMLYLEKNIPRNTTILLIDDILTTGATLDACTREIKKYLPEVSIRGVCIARNNG